MKARALKEVWNIAAVTPLQKEMGSTTTCGKLNNMNSITNRINDNGENVNEETVQSPCTEEFLARGSELLKRTRNGTIAIKD